jgi:hypothetical protein
MARKAVEMIEVTCSISKRELLCAISKLVDASEFSPLDWSLADAILLEGAAEKIRREVTDAVRESARDNE